MSDVANAELPDVDSLQPAQPQSTGLPDVDSLKPAPMLKNPGGPRAGVPASVAARFGPGDAFTRIFNNAATRFKNGIVNNFAAADAQDQENLRRHGYESVEPTGYREGGNPAPTPGSVLRFGADVIQLGIDRIENGFMSALSALPEAGAGAEGQFARETGADTAKVASAEREGGATTEALLSDVGDMHANAMLDAARAQARVPGFYGSVYRVQQNAEGGIGHVPLGSLPTTEIAKGQAQVAASALHLGQDAADTIHDIYVKTGRPPAEVLMDAKTNTGGVLSDIVAGKTPDAYPEPPGMVKPPAAPAPSPEATGVSKIGQSIEENAVRDKLAQNFSGTALYEKTTFAEQAKLSTDLVNKDHDTAWEILDGNKPLPGNLRGVSLVTAMEQYLKKNPDQASIERLANSPLVSGTSYAAAETALAAARSPDSAMGILADMKNTLVKKADPRNLAAKQAALKDPSVTGPLLPKEEMSWDRFLDSIKC